MINKTRIASSILALCFWLSSLFTWKYFDGNRSTTAQPELGRIYPLRTHGSVVYLTCDEHYFLYSLIFISVAMFLFVVISHIFEKIWG
jgi:hypothetical protein